MTPYLSFGYREDGSPGSTGAGSREAEGRRGCVGSLETGSPRGSTGSAWAGYKWGPVRGPTYSSRGRSVGLNLQSCHRKLVSAYERCSNVYGGTEKVLAGAFGGGPSSRFSLAGFRALLAAGGLWESPPPPATGGALGRVAHPAWGRSHFPCVSGSAGLGVARLWYFGVAPSVRWG